MAKKSSLKRYMAFAVAAALTLTCGCTDELDYYGEDYPEGEESRVSLKVDVSEPTVMSRANDTDVNTLWVGIYNAATGECTYNHLYGDEQASPAEKDKQFKTLTDIRCKSGKSYIVAVANPTGKYGIDLSGNKVRTPLEQLLTSAMSWDKYLSIVTDTYMADDEHISVNEPIDALLMEGTYAAEHKADKTATEIEPTDIRPGKNVLSGAIHLRRLMTQNTLKIAATGDVVSLEVTEIEIFNVPQYSWLRGRNQGKDLNKAADYANAGDAMLPDGPAKGNKCYPTSLRFNPPEAVKVDKNGVYTFTFWQFENKRTGLPETCKTYSDREREYKNTTDNSNSGIYTSLSGTSAGDLNNNATYAKISAVIEYKDPSHLVNPEGIDLPSTGSSRTATVTYVVHLGYVDDKATDFNCYRNSKYTYNIKAKSASDVLLEAFREGENAPGAEGIVTDVANDFIELDAHTSVFNIYLSTNDINTFSFTMRTYENGVPHVVKMNADGSTDGLPKYGDEDFKYYNWVELVPTGDAVNKASKAEFAPYPAVTGIQPGRKGVYYPHELRGSGLTGQWFTVYVNEYSYEKRYGETGYGDESKTGAWKGYVNQPARQVWFNVEQQISSDGESVYFGSKYAFRQQSIQTYYDYNMTTCTSAIGLEHTNESFGMNIRWTLSKIVPWEYNANNGRLNVANAVSASAGTTAWNTVIDINKQQKVNEIDNTDQANGAKIDTKARSYFVPANKNITVNGSSTYNTKANSNDPQTNSRTAQYIQAMHACMNRNRDENGNGKIDLAEVKWFLPSSGNYMRMVLGRSTLSTPLMEYSQTTLPAGCGSGFNTLYHFISSDAKILWLEEGMSTSNFYNQQSSGQWTKAPWQLRCIRALGTDLTNVYSEPSSAFKDNEKDTSTNGGMVTVQHYYGTALREPTTSALPFHKSNAPQNRIALYGFEIAPAGNSFDATTDHKYEAQAAFNFAEDKRMARFPDFGYGGSSQYAWVSDSIAAATPCAHLNRTCSRKGWRVPNQVEIVIIMRMGLLQNNRTNYDYTYEDGDKVYKKLSEVYYGTQLTCTQEYWANYTHPGQSTAEMSWDYRILTVEPAQGIGTASENSRIGAVRCVRDLTREEALLSYKDLIKK